MKVPNAKIRPLFKGGQYLMKKGLLTTLLAAAASVSGIQAVHANAPTISSLPDVTIGDNEDNNGATDNNFFVYTNAFRLDDKVSDDNVGVGQILWSFAEGSDPAPVDNKQWFRVNGKDPLNGNGTTITPIDATTLAKAVRPDLESGNKNIRSVSDYASFRDIVLSPGTGPLVSGSGFPTNAADQAEHALGKVVTFFASDGNTASSDDILVKSVNNANDSISGGVQYTKIKDNQFTTSTENWTSFGDSTPPLPTLRKVDYDQINTALRAYVGTGNTAASTPTDQKFRIIGWKETERSESASSNELQYAQVGANNWIRAKFHLFGQNAAGGNTVPDTNRIPNFRLRVSAANFSFASLLDLQHHQSGSALDTLARDMAPTTDPANPRVYRVDLDPPEIAAFTSGSNPATQGFVRIYETYAKDTEPQENGYLCLGESSIGIYARPTTFTPVKTYGSADFSGTVGTNAGQVTQIVGIIYSYSSSPAIEKASLNGSAFPGYTAAPEITFTPSASGYTIDTQGVEAANSNQQKIAIGTADWTMGASGDTAATKARVEAGKQYRYKFSLTSTVASNIQAQIRLRGSTFGFLYNPRLEIGGSQGSNFAHTHQYLPGTGGWNGPTNTHDLIFVSPFTVNPAAMNLTSAGHLGSEPGPGSTAAGVQGANTSARDLLMGFDVIDEFVNTTVAKGRVTLQGVTIESFPLQTD
jgi:hypothetical protein